MLFCFFLGLTVFGSLAMAGEAMAVDEGGVAPVLAQGDFDFGDLNQGAAVSDEDVLAIIAGLYTVILFGSLIGVALQLVVCYLLYSAAAAIPEEHQQLSPPLVWLMLIPCVNIVMIFFVFPGLVKGFQSYFASVGNTEVGDCGESLLVWFYVTFFLCGPVNLVLLIMYLVKFTGYKNMIAQQPAA
ncbi:MAG: hypothetical protein DWQ35_18825 [Planctomycetota bacterium]|nr:MAG: hypothetical protein DWQ35_18825 [Planctomycetota bacterium]REK17484.1 MAG: hypothetical protein DWQ42_22395 [Planctomycetota bacterium]REK42422.1 MAG: hypothetical protein DWQ46_13070 [Planctomycetota bacterium]